jgi:hypothetical protein
MASISVKIQILTSKALCIITKPIWAETIYSKFLPKQFIKLNEIIKFSVFSLWLLVPVQLSMSSSEKKLANCWIKVLVQKSSEVK